MTEYKLGPKEIEGDLKALIRFKQERTSLFLNQHQLGNDILSIVILSALIGNCVLVYIIYE